MKITRQFRLDALAADGTAPFTSPSPGEATSSIFSIYPQNFTKN